MTAITVLSACALLCSLALGAPQEYTEWSRRYRARAIEAEHQSYTAEERELRFERAMEHIRELNAAERAKPVGHAKATFSPNHFALLSAGEWSSRFGSAPFTSFAGMLSAPRIVTFTDAQVAAAKATGVDWQLGINTSAFAVTHVRNQGHCGACYSFAMIAALEGAWAVAGQPLSAFSEQWILDCMAPSEYVNGCNGGSINALAVSLQAGVPTVPYAKDYEFTSWNNQTTGVCAYSGSGVAQVSRGLQVGTVGTQSMEDAFMAYVATNGPLAVGIAASTTRWQHYSSGVLDCGSAPGEIDHAVALVGYGVDPDGTPYWKVKNSWSPGWGETGYVKVLRGSNSCLIGTLGVGVEIAAP